MKKSMQIGAALAGAALVVAGGSAYTAANTLTADPVAGNSQNSVTGVTATNTAYTYTGDGSTLAVDTITYTTTEDLSALTNVSAAVTNNSSNTVTCDVSTANTIACTSVSWNVAALTTIDLAVEQSQTS